ncbi:hypothetical protein AAG906_002096 [Vitis piasezkii]
MADTDPHSSEHSGESSISPSVLSELTTRMIEALSKAPTSIPATDLAIASIGIKLDEMYVADKDKLSYINSDLPQPSTIDPSFLDMNHRDINWERIECNCEMMADWFDGSIPYWQLHWFPMAKQVWDAIATTYFNGSDATQVYELREWHNSCKVVALGKILQ